MTLRDFDGDGKTDFLWRNVNNGRNVMWFMDGTTRTGSGEALGVSDADWSIGASGISTGTAGRTFCGAALDGAQRDLADGRGDADRLGDTVVLGNPDWQLAGLEDFDGDGKTDFLWRSVSTGRNVMWFMDGVTRTGAGDTLALNDPDWTLTGFGDYNGDRRSDFLWHSASTGRNVMWFMDGTARIGSGIPSTCTSIPGFRGWNRQLTGLVVLTGDRTCSGGNPAGAGDVGTVPQVLRAR
ncbi:MAG: VCBS repeat-containing protein [Gammaproteobacteria bacterium]|nr:VCBS repeat-containing protein [Gammaproteobacteria bacterium]